jgi:hypothetical protein
MRANPKGRVPHLTGKTMTTDATPPGVSRGTHDWEAVERAYRAGILSIREVAKQHGLTEGAVRKRAKQKGWARDLSSRVREKVRTDLVRIDDSVRETVRTEEAAVDEAASQVVAMVREHRRDIRQLRSLAEKLGVKLEGELNRVPIDDEKPVPTGYHAATLRDLSTTLKTLIPLERQAFNADEPEPPKGNDGVPATALDALLGKLAAIVPQVAA